MKFEWEEVETNVRSGKFEGDLSVIDLLARAKVFGGWLLKHECIVKKYFEIDNSSSMTFIPDPNHKWTIEK